MKGNKVEEKDLTGDIKGFPIEVAQAMVDNQVKQGNKADIKVFKRFRPAGKSEGGFYWDETEEGRSFWRDVVLEKRFYIFFKEYPRDEPASHEAQEIDAFQSITNRLHDIYVQKNHDYGDSFHQIFEKRGMAYALGHIEEKMLRIDSLQDSENAVANESYVDSIRDLANYSILTLMELERKGIKVFNN